MGLVHGAGAGAGGRGRGNDRSSKSIPVQIQGAKPRRIGIVEQSGSPQLAGSLNIQRQCRNIMCLKEPNIAIPHRPRAEMD